MKKLKKIIATGCAVIMTCSAMSMSVFAYSDCNNEAVETLTELEVLSGYDDGTFKPEALISRAEFAKIISVINGAEVDSWDLEEHNFSDVDSNHWALNYIVYCSKREFVDGYEDGTFRPNENISFAEAVKVCLTVIGYNSLITEQSENWYEPWIDLAYEYNIIDTKDIDPNGKITRAEVADMVAKTINLPLYITTGFEIVDGVIIPTTAFADGAENPFQSLLTTYLQ